MIRLGDSPAFVDTEGGPSKQRHATKRSLSGPVIDEVCRKLNMVLDAQADCNQAQQVSANGQGSVNTCLV